MGQLDKKINILTVWGIGTLIGFTILMGACTTGQRITMAEKTGQPNIRQPFKSEQRDTTKRIKLPQQIKYKDNSGSEQVLSADLDTVTGEYFINQQLSEITVTAASKSVAERNGKISIDFIVTVPKDMMQQDWRLVVNPVLDNMGERRKLDSLQIAGFENYYYNLRRQRGRARSAKYQQKVRNRELGTTGWMDPDKKNTMLAMTPDGVYDQVMDSYNNKAGTKVDTVMNKDGDYIFYYPQQIKTDNMATHLKVWFETYLVNQGDNIYRLDTSDTLHFYISSFLQFLDHTPRYVRKTIQRRVTDKMSANIQFKVGKSELVDTLGNNREETERIMAKLEEIYNGNEFLIDSVTISAYASPEGGLAANRNLAQRRGLEIVEYLKKIDTRLILPEEDAVRTRTEGEDWNRLREAIYKEPHVVNAVEILKIIDTEKDLDKREQRIRREYPTDYNYIRENLYPQLRAVDFVFHLARRNMVEEVMFTDEIDTDYADAIELMKKRQYKQAMPKLLEYRDWNTAVCYMSLGYNNMALQILSEQPESADQLYLMAILHARENRTEQAVQAYMKSCELDESKIMRGELDPEIAELIKAYNLNAGYY